MRLIAAVALLLLLVSPAGASRYQETPQELAKWAGCKAAVTTSDEHSIFESFYHNDHLYIGTMPGETPEVYEMVILHEIGHCLQDQELEGNLDQFYPYDTQFFELNADMRAADLACRRGQEGSRLGSLLLDRAHEKFGYNGDDNHGTLEMRRLAAMQAPACRIQPIQGA